MKRLSVELHSPLFRIAKPQKQPSLSHTTVQLPHEPSHAHSAPNPRMYINLPPPLPTSTPHLAALSTKSLSNFPTSLLNPSTSSQQSSGRRSFVRRHCTSFSLALSASGLVLWRVFRAESLVRRDIISACTVSWLRSEGSADDDEGEGFEGVWSE